MAGAGHVVLFVCFMVGCSIWTVIYLTLTAHYFLTVIIESSAGIDEIQFPTEGILERWWKPLFCLWILAAWVVPTAVFCGPLLAGSPVAFGIGVGLLLVIVYPLSLLSALSAQNWFFFMHPVVLWRMLRHYGSFAYVYLLTLLSASVCAGLLFAVFTHSFLWALPAAFVLPTAILFYARHWGRFAWLSLSFMPRKEKRQRDGDKTPHEETAPEMDVQEIDPADEGIRAGLPPGHSQGIHAGVPMTAGGIVAGAPPTSFPVEEDEWTADKKPYLVVEDPTQPAFQETASAPIVPAATQTTVAPAVEEEDEWATDKKPYPVIGGADFAAPAPTESSDGKSDADKPLMVSKYYDDRHKREKEAKRKAKEEATRFGLPAPSKKTPTFRDALFFGVWRFMIYERTLRVWVNLVVLTIVELLFLFMVLQFFSQLPLE